TTDEGEEYSVPYEHVVPIHLRRVSKMLQTTPEEITARVIASFDQASPRLQELMTTLVRHLHAFAIEVGLTQAEWREAIAVLRATGEITDERRQEFSLWSDALGLSMLADAIEHDLPEGATESTVLNGEPIPGAELDVWQNARCRTRSRPTVRSGACSLQADATLGGPRTST